MASGNIRLNRMPMASTLPCPASADALPLRTGIRCINCWAQFAPEDVVWIPDGQQALGDPVLGSEFAPRFQALRFGPEGDAIDAWGGRCFDIACPKCHLAIPRQLVSTTPVFVSVVGSPACGKSFFLAAMTWKLRRVLRQMFQLDFADADRVSNRALTDYERAVFLQHDQEKYVPVSHLIPKTEMQGHLYNSVRLNGQSVLLPRPLSFQVSPTVPESVEPVERLSRLLCLYDNAGEHFLPGQDTSMTPGTRHLALSDVIVFLFDPLQDPRFVARVGDERLTSHLQRYSGLIQQDVVLRECLDRIRRHAVHERKDRRPPLLIVALTKMDEWLPAIEQQLPQVPPYTISQDGVTRVLNLSTVRRNSDALQRLLRDSVPELVHAACSFSEQPVFMAASALGVRPQLTRDGRAVIRPCDVNPDMVELPSILGLARTSKTLIQTSGSLFRP
jgi:hypothetical protein